ncbi:alpha/beta fold hydrolase [Mycobacterium parmense]|uniref:Alpha/beta hydrolase n=1 Tax=Mycobacterium parmense TaxID=185642 RepID=A0A7I7YRJ1_9MYCO|nr:alpha/beta hydrolase [Mycobacterium parmense]MCV7349572.1 alpha/beta hydrolase [Mycobacterium parmense]ORW58864.1 alpha/beta hydrolase [Mycobacterium parmense]BBZ43794.1 alpha/beta hydrolase [Mycobacterium parmense]
MHAELERWRAAGAHFDYLGFNVFYRSEGSGPPLLLIHGYPFNSWDWAPIWPTLARRFTVIAPDMLGMGFSDKPFAYGYSVHDHADMHEALLAELGVRHCHILAHDIGDSVAQEMLTRHDDGTQSCGPVRIDSLTWLNGGLFNEVYTPRPAQILLSQTPLGTAASRMRRFVLSKRVLDRVVDELFGPYTKPSQEMRQIFNEVLEYNDGKRVTHKVGRFVNDRMVHRNRWVRAMRNTTVPLRLIDGPADPNSGRHMAARYLEVIPGADVVMLGDDIGHWPQIEAPAAVLEHLLDHIDRVGVVGGEPHALR